MCRLGWTNALADLAAGGLAYGVRAKRGLSEPRHNLRRNGIKLFRRGAFPLAVVVVWCWFFWVDFCCIADLIIAKFHYRDQPEVECISMSNPYQTPVHYGATGSHSGQADVGTVISGQKQLIFSILGYLCSLPLLVSANAFLAGTPEKPIVTPLFGVVLALGLLVAFAAAISASIGIFRMGRVLYPGSTRYIYAIGVLIPAPLIGLIVMFVANSKATGYLKAHGVNVGFFGAKR